VSDQGETAERALRFDAWGRYAGAIGLERESPPRKPHLQPHLGEHRIALTELAFLLRREGAVIAEQRAQAPGQGANPVTHGYARQHVLLHVDSGVGHASSEAGGAKSAAEWPA